MGPAASGVEVAGLLLAHVAARANNATTTYDFNPEVDGDAEYDDGYALPEASSSEDVDFDYHDFYSFPIFFEFLVHGVALAIIGLLGLMGNVLSIVILSRPQMKSSINMILIGLVSCDSLLILSSLCLFSMTVFRHTGAAAFSAYYWHVYPYILPVVYPVGMMAQTGSAYMTLGVTIERYLVVCRPLSARSICTKGRAKTAVLVFAVFAVIYNIPRFFEVTWDTVYIDHIGENRTVFVPTEMRKKPLYINIYVMWMYLVFMYIVPFASLAALNLRIFLEIRRANAMRSTLSTQEKKEHNLAVMLLVVVLVFFSCNILPLIVNVLELFGIQNQQLIQVSNLLVTINSSVNILIYCIFGNKFKTVFLQLLCGRPPRVQTVRTAREFRLRRECCYDDEDDAHDLDADSRAGSDRLSDRLGLSNSNASSTRHFHIQMKPQLLLRQHHGHNHNHGHGHGPGHGHHSRRSDDSLTNGNTLVISHRCYVGVVGSPSSRGGPRVASTMSTSADSRAPGHNHNDESLVDICQLADDALSTSKSVSASSSTGSGHGHCGLGGLGGFGGGRDRRTRQLHWYGTRKTVNAANFDCEDIL